ncbi:hypothetical protein FRC03_011384 [Tulasnella sp. 419]|nr:hypothetical protein FRC03_011384 [Tulasnella sp. 419]
MDFDGGNGRHLYYNHHLQGHRFQSHIDRSSPVPFIPQHDINQEAIRVGPHEHDSPPSNHEARNRAISTTKSTFSDDGKGPKSKSPSGQNQKSGGIFKKVMKELTGGNATKSQESTSPYSAGEKKEKVLAYGRGGAGRAKAKKTANSNSSTNLTRAAQSSASLALSDELRSLHSESSRAAMSTKSSRKAKQPVFDPYLKQMVGGDPPPLPESSRGPPSAWSSGRSDTASTYFSHARSAPSTRAGSRLGWETETYITDTTNTSWEPSSAGIGPSSSYVSRKGSVLSSSSSSNHNLQYQPLPTPSPSEVTSYSNGPPSSWKGPLPPPSQVPPAPNSDFSSSSNSTITNANYQQYIRDPKAPTDSQHQVNPSPAVQPILENPQQVDALATLQALFPTLALPSTSNVASMAAAAAAYQQLANTLAAAAVTMPLQNQQSIPDMSSLASLIPSALAPVGPMDPSLIAQFNAYRIPEEQGPKILKPPPRHKQALRSGSNSDSDSSHNHEHRQGGHSQPQLPPSPPLTANIDSPGHHNSAVNQARYPNNRKGSEATIQPHASRHHPLTAPVSAIDPHPPRNLFPPSNTSVQPQSSLESLVDGGNTNSHSKDQSSSYSTASSERAHLDAEREREELTRRLELLEMEERRLIEEREKRERERLELEREREKRDREEKERERQRALRRERERQRVEQEREKINTERREKDLKDQHLQRLARDRDASSRHWSASTTGSRSRTSSLAGAAGSQAGDRERVSSTSSLVSASGRESALGLNLTGTGRDSGSSTPGGNGQVGRLGRLPYLKSSVSATSLSSPPSHSPVIRKRPSNQQLPSLVTSNLETIPQQRPLPAPLDADEMRRRAKMALPPIPGSTLVSPPPQSSPSLLPYATPSPTPTTDTNVGPSPTVAEFDFPMPPTHMHKGGTAGLRPLNLVQGQLQGRPTGGLARPLPPDPTMARPGFNPGDPQKMRSSATRI